MTDSLAFIEIMLAQSALQKNGYYHGPIDGNLSESARQALMGFQKDGGLAVTGELDDALFRRFLALRQERGYATEDFSPRMSANKKY
jgi:peptidoglycan hydrolase-like protein with peptidoglycan-binding domain